MTTSNDDTVNLTPRFPRKLRLSDINGFGFVLAALLATLIMTGMSEARLRQAAADNERVLAEQSSTIQTAHCPVAASGSASARAIYRVKPNG